MDIEEQYDKIFHYCYYRIRDKNVAEDITQEVFLRFYNSNYVEQQKEIRYLYTIARNLSIFPQKTSSDIVGWGWMWHNKK